MKINVPKEVQEIISVLQEHGHDAYAVGGCVRDSLLGRAPADWDITTSAKPMEVKRIFRRYWNPAWNGNCYVWQRRI